ncbi:MAG: ATP phosphoribosyltransferase [Chloroflexota bacterium]|nr:MAG: ATP phosphoribosyltransferase [Chloroflexota bacterium]
MLNLVVPKGSLEGETFRLFTEADLPIRRRSDREYNAGIADPRIGQVKILRPQEIAIYVQQGYFDLGITGCDWIHETNSDVVEVMDLPYNKTGDGPPVRIVLAVGRESGVRDARQMPPNSRISTEYPNITRRFFQELDLPVQVFPSHGATEAKVPEIADAVVEITETGSTLIRHGMDIIATLMESSTKLIANRDSYADPVKRAEIDEITTLLTGVMTARGKVLLKMNVPEDKLNDVVGIVPGMKSPTVSRLFNTTYYALETVVVKSEVNLIIPSLKKAGAEDILELPISKIVF